MNQNNNEIEINILEYLLFLIQRKWIILSIAIISFTISYSCTQFIPPTFISDTNISRVESTKSSSANLSGFGNLLGGSVVSQLNTVGSATLIKIMNLLSSRDFHSALIEKYKLTPYLLPKYWNSSTNGWKDGMAEPKAVKCVGLIIKKLEFEENKISGILNIKFESKDSVVSDTVMKSINKFLDIHIKNNIQKKAEENITYLEEKLLHTEDPLLRLKIKELIASEIEKEMLVSKNAFKTIDNIYTRRAYKYKEITPFAISFSLTSLYILALLIYNTVLKFKQTDKQLLDSIGKELLSLPVKKTNKTNVQ